MRADIAETVAYWKSTGITAGTVWESVTGRAGRHIRWVMVASLLESRSEPAVRVPLGYSIGPDGCLEDLGRRVA